MPVPKILLPAAFCSANLIIYWGGFDTIWKLGVAMVVGLRAVRDRCGVARRPAPKRELRSALLGSSPWLAGHVVLGALGRYGGGYEAAAELGRSRRRDRVLAAIYYLAVQITLSAEESAAAVAKDAQQLDFEAQPKRASRNAGNLLSWSVATHDLAAHVHHEDEDAAQPVRRAPHAVGRRAHRRDDGRRARSSATITDSIALKADGWHMGTHVGALGLTLVAYWYARTRAGNDTFSFGTGKVYALAGYTSGVLLALVALWMAYEGVEQPDRSSRRSTTARRCRSRCVGFVVNIVSAMLLGARASLRHDHARPRA